MEGLQSAEKLSTLEDHVGPSRANNACAFRTQMLFLTKFFISSKTKMNQKIHEMKEEFISRLCKYGKGLNI